MAEKRKILEIGVAGVWRYNNGLNSNRSLIPKSMQIDYIDVPTSRAFGSALPLALQTSFKAFDGYDIVHNLSTYPFYPRGRKNFILVTTAHEMQPVLHPELTPVRLRSFSDRLWEELISKPGLNCLFSSDYAIAGSKQTVEGLVKGGFDRKRIFLTPLGIDKRFFSPIKKHKSKAFKVGTIGTCAPQKNTFFSIDAIKAVEDQNVEFEIWGKSTYGKALFDERINGDSRIKIMGLARDQQIIDIYDSFDAFVFPSLFEGFGIPIIEAKSRGLPVILYKGGYISPEIREHCFEARDPEHMAEIIDGIKANGYNQKLRKKAIASARKFTWDVTMRETIKAYSRMEK
jgi:glycosyltransferase involved in cell wall biosynthesis